MIARLAAVADRISDRLLAGLALLTAAVFAAFGIELAEDLDLITSAVWGGR